MDIFSSEYKAFLSDFGKGRKMVLSTSENDMVSSRMMSVVQINGIFYFQTDITFRKYHQLLLNPNAALCADNIQIEGLCREIGHPLDNKPFCDCFSDCFKGSFDAYTSLKNERLFAFAPAYIERWIYKNGVPFIESFSVKEKIYRLNEYKGV